MQRLGSRETDMTLADMRDYKETHLKWYDNGRRFRVRLRPRWTDADLADYEANDSSDDEYDAMVRSTQGYHRKYAPMTERVTFELNRSIIEGSNALVHNPGTVESDATLRETMKVSTQSPYPISSFTNLYLLHSKCFYLCCCCCCSAAAAAAAALLLRRKLVTILGCASPGTIDVHAPSTSMIQASGAATSSSHAGATTSHARATSHAGGTSHAGESEEEEVDSQDDECPEEMNMSQMMDTPPVSQAKRVSHPHEDPFSPSPFQKEVPRRCKKTVNAGCSKRGRK